MATGNITINAVLALAPGQTLWDAGHREAVPGFGVRRQRGTPVYVIKYRVFGRQRFVTIAKHGQVTPAEARKEAKRLLGSVAGGADPADTKAQARAEAGDTLHHVATAYLKAVKPKQRPRTYSEIERYLLGKATGRASVWKPLHSASVFKITRRQVSQRLAKITESHGAVSAARARAALSAMFAWAIREGYEIPANPVLGSNRPAQPKARDRVLTDAELAEIWRACGDDDYGRIIRLLILTGQRRDEVGGLMWPELDTVAARWTITGARTKNHREHVLPLTSAALALLPARRNDRDHVFGDGPRREGDRERGFSGWSKAKAELDDRILVARRETDSEAQPMPAWVVHDLRRSVATGMADRLAVLPHIVEALLNHVSGHRSGVAGVYNRARYAREMQDALRRWADHVAAAVRAASRPKSLRLVRVSQGSAITNE